MSFAPFTRTLHGLPAATFRRRLRLERRSIGARLTLALKVGGATAAVVGERVRVREGTAGGEQV